MTPVPDVLTLAEVAAIMRISERAIYAKLARGTMIPLPIAEHPYRWNRADLDRWVTGAFREAAATLRQRAALRSRTHTRSLRKVG